jgi:hypothetical protein
MKHIFLPLGFLALAACMAPTDDAQSPQADANRASLSKEFCENSDNPECRFANAPVKLSSKEVRLPGRPYVFYPLADTLEFVDRGNRRWIAPPAILTDGASIPPRFVSIVGSPTSPEFQGAAAIHDSYCGIGNEDTVYYHTRPWKEVHRMFYEALRVGGTPQLKAKAMYAAVYMGGPRWSQVKAHPTLSTRGETLSTQGIFGATNSNGVLLGNFFQNRVPEDDQKAALQRIVDKINRENPSILDLEREIDAEMSETVIQAEVRQIEEQPEASDDDYTETTLSGPPSSSGPYCFVPSTCY